MHREVAPHFESIEEALQFHSNRPASARKIPVIWSILDKDPKSTNRRITEQLADKGLYADGTLIGEIRRSVRKVKGLPARKPRKISTKSKRVRGSSPKEASQVHVDAPIRDPGKGDLVGIPSALSSALGRHVGAILEVMSSHGVCELSLHSEGLIKATYENKTVTGKV